MLRIAGKYVGTTTITFIVRLAEVQTLSSVLYSLYFETNPKINTKNKNKNKQPYRKKERESERKIKKRKKERNWDRSAQNHFKGQKTMSAILGQWHLYCIYQPKPWILVKRLGTLLHL